MSKAEYGFSDNFMSLQSATDDEPWYAETGPIKTLENISNTQYFGMIYLGNNT